MAQVSMQADRVSVKMLVVGFSSGHVYMQAQLTTEISAHLFYGSQCFYCSAMLNLLLLGQILYRTVCFLTRRKYLQSGRKQIWMKINFCELREPSSSHLLNVTQNTSDQYNLCWLNGLQGYHIHLQKVFIVPRSIHHPQSFAKCNYMFQRTHLKTLRVDTSLWYVHEISTL